MVFNQAIMFSFEFISKLKEVLDFRTIFALFFTFFSDGEDGMGVVSVWRHQNLRLLCWWPPRRGRSVCKSLISAQFVISKSQKCAWLVSRTDSARSSRTTKNLSMPTIGESSEASYANEASEVPINGTGRRPIRTRSCRLPASSSSSMRSSSRRVLESQQPRSRSLGLEGSLNQMHTTTTTSFLLFFHFFAHFMTMITLRLKIKPAYLPICIYSLIKESTQRIF